MVDDLMVSVRVNREADRSWPSGVVRTRQPATPPPQRHLLLLRRQAPVARASGCLLRSFALVDEMRGSAFECVCVCVCVCV